MTNETYQDIAPPAGDQHLTPGATLAVTMRTAGLCEFDRI
jgi:hypothetical protein